MGNLALIAYGVAFVGSCLSWVLLLAGTGNPKCTFSCDFSCPVCPRVQHHMHVCLPAGQQGQCGTCFWEDQNCGELPGGRAPNSWMKWADEADNPWACMQGRCTASARRRACTTLGCLGGLSGFSSSFCSSVSQLGCAHRLCSNSLQPLGLGC